MGGGDTGAAAAAPSKYSHLMPAGMKLANAEKAELKPDIRGEAIVKLNVEVFDHHFGSANWRNTRLRVLDFSDDMFRLEALTEGG